MTCSTKATPDRNMWSIRLQISRAVRFDLNRSEFCSTKDCERDTRYRGVLNELLQLSLLRRKASKLRAASTREIVYETVQRWS